MENLSEETATVHITSDTESITLELTQTIFNEQEAFTRTFTQPELANINATLKLTDVPLTELFDVSRDSDGTIVEVTFTLPAEFAMGDVQYSTPE